MAWIAYQKFDIQEERDHKQTAQHRTKYLTNPHCALKLPTSDYMYSNDMHHHPQEFFQGVNKFGVSRGVHRPHGALTNPLKRHPSTYEDPKFVLTQGLIATPGDAHVHHECINFNFTKGFRVNCHFWYLFWAWWKRRRMENLSLVVKTEVFYWSTSTRLRFSMLLTLVYVLFYWCFDHAHIFYSFQY